MAMKKYDVTHIDFSDLRNQKRELLKVIRERNQPDGEDDLDGIVHLIDSIQDFVCDVLGYKEHDVFDLDMDDPDYHPEPLYTNEPEEQKFAREMSEVIYENHRESEYLFIHEDMPEEFVETVLNMPENVQACKELIRKAILKDFANDPDQFTRDENNMLRYEDNMHDYGYVIETYCLEKYYEGKTKHVWICPNCGSDNVELKRWHNPNTNKIGVDCEDDEGWCGDCEEHCDLSYVELKFLSKIIGYQVRGGDLGDSVGRLHPDMASPTSVYNLGQANEVLRYSKRKSDAYWSLSTVWSGDIENPMMMFEGDIRGDNKELL